MLDFKPKRKLKVKKSTPLSRLLSKPVVRFSVAGLVSLLVTLLLFIFMNYLLGNFDKYAENITERLFSLHLTRVDQDAGGSDRIQRIQRPAEPPELPEQLALPPEPPAIQEEDKPLAEQDDALTNEQRRKMIIESILENSEDADNTGNKDNNTSGSR